MIIKEMNYMSEAESYNEDDIPTLYGYGVEQENTLYVWCSYCKKWHMHGLQNLGHRTAHCFDWNSPYRKGGGYFLERVFKLKNETLSQLKKRIKEMNS